MKLNRKWILVMSLLLSVAMAVGGTLAYMQDTETTTNTFTIGNVDITLTEPSWNDAEQHVLAPGAYFAKDPTITNVGKNAAYVWMDVVVPTEIYDDYINLVGAWGSGWMEYTKTTKDGQTTITLLYSDVLAANGGETSAAFDAVEMKTTVTTEMVTELTESRMDIVVNAYAIEETSEFEDVEAAYNAFNKINEVTTPEELLAALANGGKVKIGADIDMATYTEKNKRLDISSDTVLDLNGHKLTSKDGGNSNTMAIYVQDDKSLTMEDSAGNGELIASCYGVYVRPGATFTMNGGSINVSGNGVYDMGVVVWNGKFVMNAGSITGLDSVVTSNYWKNNSMTEAPFCEVTIVDGCTLNSTYYDIDTSDAPDTVLNVPATLSVYNGSAVTE